MSEVIKRAKSKAGGLIPELRFPEFEMEGEWEKKPLNNVCDINPSNNNLPQKFIYIDLESVESGRLQKKNIITLYNAPSRAQRLLNNGDVIFQMVRPYQKNNLFFQSADNYHYVASTGYAQLRAYQSSMFLFQYIHTDNFVNRVLANCTGSNYPAISSTALSKIKIEIPTLPEQQKIATCLSSLDELIAAHNDKLQALKDHKKGLMQNLFPQEGEKVPKYRFPEFEKDGEWVEKKLGKIGEPLMCKRIFKEQTTPNPEKGIPFYKIGTFGKEADAYIPEDLFIEYKNKYNYPNKGDILISASGTIGRLVIYDGSPAYYQDSNIVWLGHDENQVTNEFLFYCYLMVNWQTSDGGVIKRLYNSDLKNVSIFFPENELEQQKIASCLSALDELITAQAEKIEQLQEHKKGLMQGLFPKNEN
jgi:type I restriction enzyme S subunit